MQAHTDPGPAKPGCVNRRPLRTRSAAWVQASAAALGRAGVSPNAISLAGIGFAAAGAAAMLHAASAPLWWIAGATGIQLRLAANMLDGMVAVEGGRQTATGLLFNEVPDRIEDSLLLVAAGYAAGIPALGWLAALLACGTAYVRVLGGALGFAQDFSGPQAKPQRMAALTMAALASAAWPAATVMPLALAVIAAGTALTLARRTLRLAGRLRGEVQ